MIGIISAEEIEKLYNAQYIQTGSISSSTDEYIAFKYNPNNFYNVIYDVLPNDWYEMNTIAIQSCRDMLFF